MIGVNRVSAFYGNADDDGVVSGKEKLGVTSLYSDSGVFFALFD